MTTSFLGSGDAFGISGDFGVCFTGAGDGTFSIFFGFCDKID
jgi:hypothetical protein